MTGSDSSDIDSAWMLSHTNIEGALGLIPIVDPYREHIDVLMDGLRIRSAASSSVTSDVPLLRKIPVGAWALLMRLMLSSLGREGSKQAVRLLRTMRVCSASTSVASSPEDELLDACAEVLCELAGNNDPDYAPEGGIKLALALLRLAKASESFGYVELACNLALDAINACNKNTLAACALAECAATYALNLAFQAGGADQIALWSVFHASVVVLAADHMPERRAEAFKACELAIERIDATRDPVRNAAAHLLTDVVHSRDYLAPMMYRIISLLPSQRLPPELQGIIETIREPARTSNRCSRDWLEQLRAYFESDGTWRALEIAKFSVEPSEATSAVTDWTAWTIDHPAYRRAVPHHRSFASELGFDSQVLILTHEITHVFSLMGAIGAALTCLRVAVFRDEVFLWSATLPDTDLAQAERLAAEGVAPLAENNFTWLLRTERALESTLKARDLQDTWIPWFEGLAIFGELCADQTEDPRIVDPVASALLNMLDNQPLMDTTATDLEAKISAQRQLISDFLKKRSDAIARLGPMRLSRYLRENAVPYLAGYLAVRAVVATWRNTIGRRLSGADAFRLALSATRSSTAEAIPDLSLSSDVFRENAQQLMCEWVRKLGRLSKAEIEAFLYVPNEGLSFTRWHNVRIRKIVDDRHGDAQQAQLVKRWMRQALTALTKPEDAERMKSSRGASRWGAGLAARHIREYMNSPSFNEQFSQHCNLVSLHMARRSLLPIGRTSAKFFVNIGSEDSDSCLVTLLRTTEAHVKHGEPSINMASTVLRRESAERLAKAAECIGDPRIDVTRVIDLGGAVAGRPGLSGWHFLAYHYYDWFELRGSTNAVDAILNDVLAETPGLLDIFESRLYPDRLTRAEAEIIAQGERGARRTRDWIDQSRKWQFMGIFLDMDFWADHVRGLADRVIAEADRPILRRQSAKRLIAALFDSETLAEHVVEEGFSQLTNEISEHRDAILDVLIRTAAIRDCDNAEVATVVDMLRDCGLDIMARTASGWDVRSMA